ncbi:hypothetical protein EKD16_19635 [Streptomonospora litoralis]|uniref:Uncharacterized protein n=1 Tax=Streptomonospora litoralis TaxID=2498135 RepID=A0A4P6Q5W4_9ACTN|nr:hypothetical protein EKD16_19635 [Streptomonospora litoralis]
MKTARSMRQPARRGPTPPPHGPPASTGCVDRGPGPPPPSAPVVPRQAPRHSADQQGRPADPTRSRRPRSPASTGCVNRRPDPAPSSVPPFRAGDPPPGRPARPPSGPDPFASATVTGEHRVRRPRARPCAVLGARRSPQATRRPADQQGRPADPTRSRRPRPPASTGCVDRGPGPPPPSAPVVPRRPPAARQAGKAAQRRRAASPLAQPPRHRLWTGPLPELCGVDLGRVSCRSYTGGPATPLYQVWSFFLSEVVRDAVPATTDRPYPLKRGRRLLKARSLCLV